MKYVYGIAPTAQLNGREWSLTGLHGAPLQAVACNGVTAIVSDAVPYDYAGLPKPQLVKVLAQHQQATERIMAQTATLLPVKFGTVLKEPDVQKLLQQSMPDLEQALAHVAGHIELELLVIWDPQRVFTEIAQQPEIAELRAQAAGKSAEEIQHLQIAVGALVKQLLDARREQYSRRILEALHDLADDLEVNAAVNDQVVLNLAFLLPVARQTEFCARVEELDKALSGDLLFKIVGPLPPYSFATVEIEQVLPDDIAWAQQQLGIAGEATDEEIRSAYLRQARVHHPDNNDQDPEAAALFKDDNTAYRLLRNCHAMQRRSAPPCSDDDIDLAFRCNLAQAAARGMLLVNISRSSQIAARN